MSGPAPRARTTASRAALAATGVVAMLLLALCVAVDVVVGHNLRAATQARVTQELARLTSPQDPVGEPDVDDVFVSWRVSPSGVVGSGNAPQLPASLHGVAVPRQVSIAGTDFVVAGAPFAGGRLIVGESLASVNRALSTLIVAEAAIVPGLLGLTFAIGFVVGRRVAAPLERAHRQQLTFTADASHELRTPLTVIEAETSLALSQPSNPDGDRQALQRVQREAARLRLIVNDLLWLARFDTEAHPPSRDVVDVISAASTAVERFQAPAERRQQRLVLDAPQNGAALIEAPPAWLDRLCGVLLDNACRYSAAGTTVTVRVSHHRHTVRLTVADQGPGIAADERRRIFERFHRATDDGEGAGLGLAIGDAVVHGTGGHWIVEDADGGGASVTVAWPSQPPPRTPVTRARSG